MNKENRAVVQEWINKQENNGALEIYDLYSKDVPFKPDDLKNLSLEDLVLKVLKLCKDFPTRYINTNRYQCHGNAARSVFDTWRICRYFQPQTDVFDVMHVLYNLTKKQKLWSWKCVVIHQRVFTPQNIYGFTRWDAKDEFGLSFEDYEKI